MTSPYYAPEAYAACPSVIRSPATTHGMEKPEWTRQFIRNFPDGAISLDAVIGLAGERTPDGPTRDIENFSLVVDRRPVLQNPVPTSEQADVVPKIFEAQVNSSCGFDVGYDSIWTQDSYVLSCSDKVPQ